MGLQDIPSGTQVKNHLNRMLRHKTRGKRGGAQATIGQPASERRLQRATVGRLLNSGPEK